MAPELILSLSPYSISRQDYKKAKKNALPFSAVVQENCTMGSGNDIYCLMNDRNNQLYVERNGVRMSSNFEGSVKDFFAAGVSGKVDKIYIKTSDPKEGKGYLSFIVAEVNLPSHGQRVMLEVDSKLGQMVRVYLNRDEYAGISMAIQSIEPYTAAGYYVGKERQYPDASGQQFYTGVLNLTNPPFKDVKPLFIDIQPTEKLQQFWFTTLRTLER